MKRLPAAQRTAYAVAAAGAMAQNVYLHCASEGLATVIYLAKADPESAQRAMPRYACFDHAAEDAQAYGYTASFGLKGSCEDEVTQVLREMSRRAAAAPPASHPDRDEALYAQQNACLVRNAEEYYRTMVQARVSS